MHRIIGAIAPALALLLGLAAAGPVGADAHTADRTPEAHGLKANDADLIAPTAAVTTGTLANGLRYAIVHDPTPVGAVSVRLAIAAGQYDADENELGVAHFVEHMAFAGSGAEEEQAYLQGFQALGVDHGRDRNAHTELRATTYELDLPHADGPGLDLAFRWMRHVADGATFPAAVVEREKGVLMAERGQRAIAAYDALSGVTLFNNMGNRIGRRMMNDPEASIRTTTAERLRAFYTRWYRPDNAVVVMVGDLPVEEMRARIEAAFGSWAVPGTVNGRAPPLPAHAVTEPIDLSSPAAEWTVSEPNSASEVSVCRVTRDDTGVIDRYSRLRTWIASRAWAWVLSDRLSRLAQTADAPFAGAHAWVDSDLVARGACLSVLPRDGDWKRALAAGQAELRRFAAHGATEPETELALKDLRNHFWAEGRMVEIGDTPAVAEALTSRLVAGGPIPGERASEVFEAADQGLTAKDLNDAFARDWAGAGPRISYIATGDTPPAGALTAAWKAGEQAAVPDAYVVAADRPWPYAAFGPPGHVVKREEIKSLDFVRLTFDNGVILNVKTTAFGGEPHESVEIRFGAGRREFSAQDQAMATFGAGLTPYLGFKQMSYTDATRALHGHGWKVQLQIADDAFLLGGDVVERELPTELQVLTAYMTEPGFRGDLDSALPTAMTSGLRIMRSQPNAVISIALGDALRPGQPSLLPSADRLGHVRAADFAALLQPALTTEPFEVTLVGTASEKQATDEVARTLGALPARKPVDRRRADAWFLRGLDRPLAPMNVSLSGATSAAVGAVWPLWVATPARRREELSMHLAGRILGDALRRRIREQLGKTYSPMVDTPTPDDADQGMVFALVDSAPADVDQVRAELLKAAAAVAHGDFDQDALDRARNPLVAQLDAQKAQDDWWAMLISAGFDDPARMTEFASEADILRTVTLAEVKAAAAKWLSRTPTLLTATPETAAAGPAAGH